jgi:hypothetical protein
LNLAKKSVEKRLQPKLDEFEAVKTIARLKGNLRDARVENMQLTCGKPLLIKVEQQVK